MFEVNETLIREATERLAFRSWVYWIVGGSCSGKTSVCRAISKKTGICVYDMDAHTYGAYMARYADSRHPASSAWFKRTDGLEWALSLSWDDFNSLNRTANAEFLDLFSQDISENYGDVPVLVDGGITHPSVLAAVVEPKRVSCLIIDDAESRRHWETDESRVEMRRAVQGLPEGCKAWRKFLTFNEHMSETINRESREQGIGAFKRERDSSVECLAEAVMQGLGIRLR